MDHFGEYFYPKSPWPLPAAHLVVHDLFHRFYYPLWFAAECGHRLAEGE